VSNLNPEPPKGDLTIADCVYDFSLGPVQLQPKAFYSVEVGRRGKVRYTGEQLTQPVALTLG
jgi:hypothetical protein